jgi:hypothetical protein
MHQLVLVKSLHQDLWLILTKMFLSYFHQLIRKTVTGAQHLLKQAVGTFINKKTGEYLNRMQKYHRMG